MLEARLTERQREFAEANYKVLEDFLKYRNLPMDEFYDVVVFRFLWAVKQYDEREDLKQYSFKTIAKNHMLSFHVTLSRDELVPQNKRSGIFRAPASCRHIFSSRRKGLLF